MMKRPLLIRCETLWEIETRRRISTLPEGFVFADKARFIVGIREFIRIQHGCDALIDSVNDTANIQKIFVSKMSAKVEF